jgi:hypothetical protein
MYPSEELDPLMVKLGAWDVYCFCRKNTGMIPYISVAARNAATSLSGLFLYENKAITCRRCLQNIRGETMPDLRKNSNRTGSMLWNLQ